MYMSYVFGLIGWLVDVDESSFWTQFSMKTVINLIN